LGFYTEIGIGDGIESRVGFITHVNALKVGRQLAINWQVGYIDLLVNGSVVTLEVRINNISASFVRVVNPFVPNQPTVTARGCRGFREYPFSAARCIRA
jgi:hypothetical protein